MKDRNNRPFEQNNVNAPHFHVQHHARDLPSTDHTVPPPHHLGHGEPVPPHHPGNFPPHIRDTFVRIPSNDEFWQKLGESYTDELNHVAKIIQSSPAEIKLTLSALFDFEVDFCGCEPYINQVIEYPSPLLNDDAKSAFSKIWGEDNLRYLLFVYNNSPEEQVLIAVTIARLMQNRATATNLDDDLDSKIQISEELLLSDIPLPHHLRHGAVLPPRVRHSIVRIPFTTDIKDKLEDVFGDKLNYVFRVIDSAPPEIKLTLAMLLGFKVDLSECTKYVSKAVKFTSPLLNGDAKKVVGEILGFENLNNALHIYNASPAEQVLIAVTVAKLLQNQQNDTEGAV